MTLLITGSASFVGRELIRRCHALGAPTIGLDLTRGAADQEFVGDLRHPPAALRDLTGIEAVVHLGAIARDADCKQDPLKAYDVNVLGSVEIMRLAAAVGAKQLIFASTEWVYGEADGPPRREDEPLDPMALTSEYALSKLFAECALRREAVQSETALTILRFGIIYGPRRENWSAVESLADQAASLGAVRVGAAETRRGFVHVADVADAILAAVGREGVEVFNIQPDSPISLGQVIRAAERLLGREIAVSESAPERPSVRNICGAHARTALGWRPIIDIDAGVREVLIHLGHLPEASTAGSGRP